MGPSIFYKISEAPLGRAEASAFGDGGLRRPSLKQCASRAAQRSNNEQQTATNNKTAQRI
jgi:hypothetical protein